MNMRFASPRRSVAPWIPFLLSCATALAAPDRDAVVRAVGVPRGIVAVLGERAVPQAIELARETEFLVYLQIPDAGRAETARRELDAAGVYGTRVFVNQAPLSRLGLADNLVEQVEWPSPELGQDALVNRRVALHLTGFGDVIDRWGLDPEQFATVRLAVRWTGLVRRILLR